MLAPVFSSFQRCFAVFSLLLFLQAVSPSAVFSTDTGVTKSQNANPLAEEEDENSDINLKFFCEEQDFSLYVAHYSLPSGSDLMPDGHIPEIPTPPPLH